MQVFPNWTLVLMHLVQVVEDPKHSSQGESQSMQYSSVSENFPSEQEPMQSLSSRKTPVSHSVQLLETAKHSLHGEVQIWHEAPLKKFPEGQGLI